MSDTREFITARLLPARLSPAIIAHAALGTFDCEQEPIHLMASSESITHNLVLDVTAILRYGGRMFGVSRRLLMRNSDFFATALLDKKFDESTAISFTPAVLDLPDKKVPAEVLLTLLQQLHDPAKGVITWNFSDSECVGQYILLTAFNLTYERVLPNCVRNNHHSGCSYRDDKCNVSRYAALLIHADAYGDSKFVGELIKMKCDVMADVIRIVNAHRYVHFTRDVDGISVGLLIQLIKKLGG